LLLAFADRAGGGAVCLSEPFISESGFTEFKNFHDARGNLFIEK